MIVTERERGRDTGRGRSRLHAPGARCGIRSRVSGMAPWAKRRRQTATPPRDPIIGVSRHTRVLPPSSIQRFPSNSCGRLVLHTACRVSFARLHQRRVPKTCETQLNNADKDGISRCSRVVILEPPDSEYCYLLTAERTQLGESWLLVMLPWES